ncbi:hypothetical protein [Paraburkholderia caballeronis]|uniref:hypothetical protein n=1 Tax=Paraburkholderia caballeronis TaxID=416943 RepID=UPI001065E52B|nr:hypothetical protein [Paraburkholderia caballeronis]TDV13842.1 hypothetical protein C7408_10912 [Paraburkholderia caballeronis]TDV15356.1 hypothetical protein C7406_11012 [Paraburkholderia caballeronis]TDV24823.1 hypothetical protein C7404_10912 [Paraburkholderia caballeronis]
MTYELRTDSQHRYVMYRRDERYLPFGRDDDRRKAVEKGRQFVASAYPEVWEKNVGLVQRVRQFLGNNFHWHDRLTTSGTDREVIDTLMSMVRGGSIVVIPEEPLDAGVATLPAKASSSSFWGVDSYDVAPVVSVASRYQSQLERLAAEHTAWAESQSAMDELNAGFMRKMAGTSPLMDFLFDAAGWTGKYGDKLASGTTTPGECEPFEYNGVASERGEKIDLAGLPFDGPANSWLESEPGMKQQWRMFGADGTPVVDIDFDGHHGQPNPHAHNWDGLVRDHGWPVSILP